LADFSAMEVSELEPDFEARTSFKLRFTAHSAHEHADQIETHARTLRAAALEKKLSQILLLAFETRAVVLEDERRGTPSGLGSNRDSQRRPGRVPYGVLEQVPENDLESSRIRLDLKTLGYLKGEIDAGRAPARDETFEPRLQLDR